MDIQIVASIVKKEDLVKLPLFFFFMQEIDSSAELRKGATFCVSALHGAKKYIRKQNYKPISKIDLYAHILESRLDLIKVSRIDEIKL